MNNARPSALAVMTLMTLVSFPAVAAEIKHTSAPADETSRTPNTETNAPQFAGVIDDLPLMAGLSPLTDDDVLFVTPHAGRIAETVAEGAVDIDDIYDFYRKTLPHLGWKKVDGRTYRREGDILRIDAHADGKTTTVRFSVKPASDAQ